MKFRNLLPGDVVTLMGQRSVVLAIQSPHPLNPDFWLIIFWLFGEDKGGRTSFDMLHPNYDLIAGTTVTKDGMRSYREAMKAMAD